MWAIKGWIMIGISVIGIIGSLAGIIVSKKIFERQKRDTLESIEAGWGEKR